MMMNNGVLSNLLTSATPEVTAASSSSSASRSNNNNINNVESGTRSRSFCSQPANQPFASATQGLAPPKKRGHPDPDAEVIAMSPKSLMTTNRFICEICNKGFQRDQNLQLHRRGHNLPWKLKQRNKDEVVRKKVYVCPEPTCVHHDPSRALGDLTGIKKHVSRKHGEKKWNCEKCTKRYAVQSDWKAHSKICGTREYRCDCGTLFSRRDSFTTHRAFCDTLAQESSSRSMLLQKNRLNIPSPFDHLPTSFSIKTEQKNLHHHRLFDASVQEQFLGPTSTFFHQTNPNPSLFHPNFTAGTSSHMSATALLQQAAQMGLTPSPTSTSSANVLMSRHHQVPENASSTACPVPSSGGGDLELEDHLVAGARGSFSFLMGLESFGNEAVVSSVASSGELRLPPSHHDTDQGAEKAGVASVPHHHLDHDQIMRMMNPRNIFSPSEAGILGSYLNSSAGHHDAITSGSMYMNNTIEDNRNHCDFPEQAATDPHALVRRRSDRQGMTRDFLGLRAFSSGQEGLLDVPGFELMNSTSTTTNNNSVANGRQNSTDQYQSLWQN